MLTLMFYDAHSHNRITIRICLLRSRENLYDMLTLLFYDANNDCHITLKICLLLSQDNLHDMLTLIFYDAHNHNHVTATNNMLASSLECMQKIQARTIKYNFIRLEPIRRTISG